MAAPVLASAALLLLATGALAAERQVVFDQPMCAGISGLRPFWNRPVVLTADGASREAARGNVLKGTMAIWGKELEWHDGYQRWMEVVVPDYKPKPEDRSPGLITFDAVHRSLLLRFPGMAQRLADELGKGGTIAKVELLLPYRGTERMSQGYQAPSSFTGDAWDKQEPRWHAQAWRLRRAWSADPERGPTFNGPVNGVVSWTRYGAQDEQGDRFPQALGPAEISHRASQPLDLTATLADPAFGRTLGERLRGLEDCGVLVRKVETYDAAFETPGYEWNMMTGGRGILIQAPRLVVTLADAKPEAVALPPAADPARGAWQPTAVLPDAAAFAKLRERYAFRQPQGMPDWQWQRVQELHALGGDANLFPAERRDYLKWVDDILRMPPRTWQGFDAANQLALFYTFREAFPPPVIDHLKLYWTSWLVPHLDSRDMVHNQYHQIWTEWRPSGSAFYDRTGDWRGNKSFYRESYCRLMSTMNCNHTAALGALLGGTLIGSDKAIADGRFGLEMFPLRLWSWYDGTTQESIDHYYFSHTLTAQKMCADHGPTLYDRMMGESCLAKSVEELAACFHPGIRRFVSTGGRTGVNYALAINEGVGFIVHSLSRRGALTDPGQKEVEGIPVVGHDFPPRRVAAQALDGPWGPAWASDLIDDKPLPFAMTATFKQWGAFREPTKWKKSWLGRHYGVASHDCSGGTLAQMAVWKRCEGVAQSARDVGLLTVRFGFNRTNMLDSFHFDEKSNRANPNGVLGEQGGNTSCLQHRGTMLVLSTPYPGLKSSADLKPEAQPITSIQTTAMLQTVQPTPTWEVYADGKRITQLPATLPASARITVKDGVSHLALIPIPATALGARDAEIVVKAGEGAVRMQGGGTAVEKLLVENYHYRAAQAFDLKAADQAVVDAASGGFVVVASDASEGDFAAFQQRIAAGRLADAWDAAKGVRSVQWQDGADTLDLGFRPRQDDQPDGKQDPERYFAWRTVNGAWPYLPPGIERDTTVSCMGRTGTLAKNGATLTHEPGMMGYLLANPEQGTYMFANPLPDLAWQRFTGPDGLVVEADGKVGILTVDIDVKQRRVEVKHAVAPGVAGEEIATALIVRGFAPRTVVVNRKEVGLPAGLTDIDGVCTVIPLDPAREDRKAVATRLPAARAAATAAFAAKADGAQPVMLYEPKQEHYLLTRPSPGAVRFHRQWHSGTAFVASVPGGPTVTADGRVALRSLQIDTATGTVDLDAPQYYQEAAGKAMQFAGKASAFLIFAEAEPKLVLNDRPAKAVRSLKLDGRTAWVLPVPGGEPLRDDAGLAKGAAEAKALAVRR